MYSAGSRLGRFGDIERLVDMVEIESEALDEAERARLRD
jgi:hypothetical protein